MLGEWTLSVAPIVELLFGDFAIEFREIVRGATTNLRLACSG